MVKKFINNYIKQNGNCKTSCMQPFYNEDKKFKRLINFKKTQPMFWQGGMKPSRL